MRAGDDARGDTDERFRKSERLRKRHQFLRTRRRGQRAGGKWVVVYALANERAHSRLGVTVSKRVGNAVVRNRTKRRLREIFRRGKGHFGDHYDVVIIAKRSRKEPSFEQLRSDVYRTVDRAIGSGGRRGEKR